MMQTRRFGSAPAAHGVGRMQVKGLRSARRRTCRLHRGAYLAFRALGATLLALSLLVSAAPLAWATDGDFYAAGTVYGAATYGPASGYINHPNLFDPNRSRSAPDTFVVDINAQGGDMGRDVFAPADGSIVVHADTNDGWGNYIIWTSADGSERIHVSHLQDILVGTGPVAGGTLIGHAGNTGKVEEKNGYDGGAHLHVAREVNGQLAPLVLSGHEITPGFEYDGPQYVSAGPVVGQVAPPPSPSPSWCPIPDGPSTAIVIDVSTSMDEWFAGGVKIEEAKHGAEQLVDVIHNYSLMSGSINRVAVTAFSTLPYKKVPLTDLLRDYNQVKSVIRSLRTVAATNIWDAVEAATEQLSNAPQGSQKIMIFLSDGLATDGETNRDKILAGPVAAAQQAGIKIYTVGIGDRFDLDEALLKAMAAQTGGRYFYADARSAGSSLASVFLKAQVSSSQRIVLEKSGSVAQGQTKKVGTFSLNDKLGWLRTLLSWPGSTLGARLSDPQGKAVGTGYPGYKEMGTGTTAQVVIQDPMAGQWTLAVEGQDVTGAAEKYYSLVSFQKAAAGSVTSGAGGGGGSGVGAGAFLLVVALAGAGLVAWLVVKSRQGEGAPALAGAAGAATLALVDAHSRRYPLRAGVNAVGRDFGNDVMLDSSSVSRRHATLAVGNEGLEVRDLGSTFGTKVNGTRVGVTHLSVGDEVAFGEECLRVRDLGGGLPR